jgi:DNA-binding GntR family transcriptional regulator
VDQLYEMRMLIEARLMRSLRWPSSDEYDSIEKLWTRWLEELRVGDLEVANENYGQALSSIWELSSLDLFIREARRFWYRTNPYRMVTFAAARAADPTMKSLRSDATALLGGLREHNRPAILHATTSRLKRARQNWLRIFAPTNGAARTARPIV